MKKKKLLRKLNKQNRTQDWDIVVAYDASRVNTLFKKQYAQKFAESGTFQRLDGEVVLSPIGKVYADIDNVLMGPPLAQFHPQGKPKKAKTSFDFLDGAVREATQFTVNVGDGNTKKAKLVQRGFRLVPADDSHLHGIIPLAPIEGAVDQQKNVVLRTEKGTSFLSDLNFDSHSEQSKVGDAIKDLLAKQEEEEGFKYVLGAINLQKGSKLKPESFRISTQADAEDPQDDGRVLYFVATQQNPHSGKQTNLGIANVVPDGYESTFLLSNNAFTKLWRDSIRDSLSARVSREGGNGDRYALHMKGSIDLPPFDVKKGNKELKCKSRNSPPFSIDHRISWKGSFYGEPWWYKLNTGGLTVNVEGFENGQSKGDASLGLTATLRAHYHAKVLEGNKNQIKISCYSGSSIENLSVSGGDESWYKNNSDLIEKGLVGPNSPAVKALTYELDSIKAFATSNLLFPEHHNNHFKDAHIAFDLAAFGQIEGTQIDLDPVDTIVAASKTRSIKAMRGGKDISEDVKWSVHRRGQGAPGTIDGGTYHAPDSLQRPGLVIVTASDPKKEEQTSGIIRLTPNRLHVSPYIRLLADTPRANQKFTAFSPESNLHPHEVQWSITPSSRGSIGHKGNYVVPNDVSDVETVSIVAKKRNSDLQNAIGRVVLFPGSQITDNRVAIFPWEKEVQPGDQVDFDCTFDKDVSKKKVNWKILPSNEQKVGQINSSGRYKAPSSIDRFRSAVVIAQHPEQSKTRAIAVLDLLPGSN